MIAALTIAGSDSGGGAGIQADLRSFHRLGVFGTSAITALTAQNLGGVSTVHGAPADFVVAQIDAVLTGFEVAAIKTGMLWSADIVTAVAARLAGGEIPLVVDPVMVATTGDRLLSEDAVGAYRDLLIPRATLVTPNLDEAAVLLGETALAGHPPVDLACRLRDHLGTDVLLKGGHRPGEVIDVLARADGAHEFRHPRVQGGSTHGSGCILSAAIAATLARGAELAAACEQGLSFVHDALARGSRGRSPHLAAIETASASPSPLREEVLPRPRAGASNPGEPS